MTGLSNGNVRCLKTCTREAPSINAASNGSLGKAAKPAKNNRYIKGVHCQISIIVRAQKAYSSEENQLGLMLNKISKT